MSVKFAPGSEGLLSILGEWFEDNTVSEILINQPEEIWIESKGQMQRHAVPYLSVSLLRDLCQLIANENGQRLTLSMPLLSGTLQDGSRVQIVLPPTAKHYTLSIRRQVVRSMNLDDYRRQQFYQQAKPFYLSNTLWSQLPEEEKELVKLYQAQHWDSFIRLAIFLKKNIVISGGTSSGKTTFLNACLQYIPLNERILILEDAREVVIPHPNQVQLLASKGEQGLAKVDMQQLVQCCLRLRPDRIIMGEIRGKEVLDFVGACSTGHEGSITSIHANNPRVAFMRMTQMYKQNNVPSMSDEDILRELHEVVDVIVQIAKTSEGRIVQSVYYKHADVQQGD
jgi:type IV secretion system protein VirB11